MFRPMIHSVFMLVVTMSLAAAMTAEAATFDETLLSVESRWAKAAYETVGQQQGRDLKSLLTDVRVLDETYPNRPEAAAWHGIIARSYVDVKSSMSIAREARDALLRAESMDPLVLGGLVYANLGALYSKAPSRFGGFGNKTKGIGYLWKAIVVDPEGIDSNYLYAQALLASLEQKL